MTRVLAPCPGTLHPVAECSDEVFAREMVGPGVLIRPVREPTTVCAAVAGRVLTLHPHAFVVAGADVAVLVHLGINTVKLEGRGFEVLVARGDEVEAGTPMVRWDPASVLDDGAGMTDEVPVVLLERPAGSVPPPGGETVRTGDVLVRLEG